MDYAAAIDLLYNLEHGNVKLGLERIESAVEMRAHPERRYATVHVAGTNGKGSTCAMIAAILEAAGYRTGLLTSPHLIDFRERIRLGGELMSREEVAALTTEFAPLFAELRLSYFEATTLLAFEAFARGGVQVAVIEVGMGGRLDATNVIQPLLCVVTGIAFDHMKSLGTTLAAIAGEKAGIMKPGAPLLLGSCEPEVHDVFAERGRALCVPVHRIEDCLRVDDIAPAPNGTRYRRWLPGQQRSRLREIRLRGEHQARNAVLAEAAAHVLRDCGLAIRESAIARALVAVEWPGRFEIVRTEPTDQPVILDVAHNPQGAEVLVETYRCWMGESGAPALVVGMLADKDHERFLTVLRRLSTRLYLIPLDSPRAGPLADLITAARAAGFEPQACSDMKEALAAARRQPAPVLVTGSFLTIEAGMQELGVGAREQLFEWAGRPRIGAPAGNGGSACARRAAPSGSTSAARR